MPRFFDKYKGLKDSFIKETTDNQNSQYLLINVFESCYDTEFELDKDVSEFTYEELGLLWGNMRARSVNTLISRKSVLNNYCEYAIKKGYSKTKINFLEKMYKPKDLEKYVDQNWKENKIIDRETLYEIVTLCQNAQDAAIFMLLFEGVWGEDLEELRMLRLRDVDDKNNRLLLRSTDGETGNVKERVVDVSEKCIDIVLEAGSETIYKNLNGKPHPSAKLKDFSLTDTEYVLKNTVRANSVETTIVTSATIRQRLDRIKNIIEYKYLNPTNIRLSGMVEFAKEYMKLKEIEVDQLTSDDYAFIWNRFGGKEAENKHHNKHILKRRIYDYIKD